MPIKATIIVLLFFTFSNKVAGQRIFQSNNFDQSFFNLNHQFLIGSISGNRGEAWDHKISMHYLGSFAFKKHELGLGVGFENENYFYVLPTYLHYSYQLWDKVELPKPYTEIGITFNREKDIFLANSFPGLLIAGGLVHSFQISKKLLFQLKLGYRYQETTTMLLRPSWGSGQATETLIKHKMHRINTSIGIKF